MAPGSVTPVPYAIPPRHFRNPIIVCAVIMALAASKRIIAPGSLLHDQLLPRSPTAFKTVVWAQLITFWFLYGAHTIETAVLATKLWKRGQSVLSLDWWKWIVECFIGGQFSLRHFDEVCKSRTA
jgi:hypothetical protein